MPSPRQVHQVSTRLMSLLMILIGVVLIVSTLIRGGGALAVGVVMGVLFAGAGGARIYLQTRGDDG